MTTQAQHHLDQLDEELNQLEKTLNAYTYEQLNQPAADGGWSAMQCLHHILLAEQQGLAYTKKKLSFNPKLRSYFGLSEFFRRQSLYLFLNSPIKFKAPKYLTGENLPTESKLDETLDTWRKSRVELREYLGSLDRSLFSKRIMKHPFAGRLSLTTTLAFFRMHFQRHRRQAMRVLEK